MRPLLFTWKVDLYSGRSNGAYLDITLTYDMTNTLRESERRGCLSPERQSHQPGGQSTTITAELGNQGSDSLLSLVFPLHVRRSPHFWLLRLGKPHSKKSRPVYSAEMPIPRRLSRWAAMENFCWAKQTSEPVGRRSPDKQKVARHSMIPYVAQILDCESAGIHCNCAGDLVSPRTSGKYSSRFEGPTLSLPGFGSCFANACFPIVPLVNFHRILGFVLLI